MCNFDVARGVVPYLQRQVRVEGDIGIYYYFFIKNNYVGNIMQLCLLHKMISNGMYIYINICTFFTVHTHDLNHKIFSSYLFKSI